MSAGALGFYLWWAVFLSRLVWFTVYLSVQNCFAESSGWAPDGYGGSFPTHRWPPGTTTPGCISSSALLHSHPEKNREKTGMRKHTVRSSVCISRNGTLGKTETGLQTAVPKNSDCDFPKQTMEINCNPCEVQEWNWDFKSLRILGTTTHLC